MRQKVRERAETYFDGVSASKSSRGSSELRSDGVSPSHDWHHVRRVARLAETLAEETEPGRIDEDVLFAAVWLHDIGRAKEDRGEIDDHAEWGATEAGEILRDLGAGDETVEAVQHCIRAHRYSNDVEPETREAEILSDADNLDALGAVGIARCFSYGGELGSPMHDPDLPPEADETDAGATQFNHLHKKILALPERMYTEAGREVAEERRAYVADFAERFEREVAGDA
ncbi:HD domain-containing protein [Halorussus aquaticus]|uniref:HD domain-containing protein n=1 Tax=Halorussus aquaticus TaxID=2953748 RepID=A0ABD5Q6S0_9EURY|nr:HD domain-containing protein [Halorussus aquaticus]